MKNTFGHNYSVTIFGESHGEAIGCVIDGLAPGIKPVSYTHLDVYKRQRHCCALSAR